MRKIFRCQEEQVTVTAEMTYLLNQHPLNIYVISHYVPADRIGITGLPVFHIALVVVVGRRSFVHCRGDKETC